MSKNNKTCGECRHFRDKDFKNMCFWKYSYREACADFEPLTNGDVIRQDGNRDFAEYFVYETGAMWASTLIVDKTFDTYEEAIEATEEYLNATAESGVDYVS